MVDGIRKLDCFFFHLQRKDCMEMCICICEYSSTVNCACVFVNIRYTPRWITNMIRYVYLTTFPNIWIYRGTPSFFTLVKQFYFIPLLKTSLPWQPFWFLTRSDSDGYQSRISQFGFFQIQIIYCLNKNPMGSWKRGKPSVTVSWSYIRNPTSDRGW